MSIDQLQRNSALDYDTGEIQLQLAGIVAKAERAEDTGEEIPASLLAEMQDTANQLLDVMPVDTIDQLAATSLANVYHFTKNDSFIEPVLEVVKESPEYSTETKAPIASAIVRVAETGMSIHESMQIEFKNNPVKDVSGPSVSELPSEPLGPEYDWLYDRNAVR